MIAVLLKKVTSGLNLLDIQYMLSGSLALNYYTIPRSTHDIDLVIALFEEQLEDFLNIFGDEYYVNRDTVIYETKRRGMFNIIDYESGYKIDFILRKNTDYRLHEFNRKKKVKIDDLDVWIVSPEDLIISKIEWIQKLQSEKQINDIKLLLDIEGIDKNYIIYWCDNLKINTFDLL